MTCAKTEVKVTYWGWGVGSPEESLLHAWADKDLMAFELGLDRRVRCRQEWQLRSFLWGEDHE